MIKKYISVILLILCCGSLCLILKNNPGEISLDQLYVNQETWDQLISTRQKRVAISDSDGLFFNKVWFNGYALAYDRQEKVFLYSLIENNKKSFNPSVRITGSDDHMGIAFLGNPISEQLISKNETIDVLIYSDTEYECCKLKCTTLPIMEISISTDKITEENTKVRLKLFDNRSEAVYRIVDSEADIHIRGKNSKSFPKKDYRISLKEKRSGNNWNNHHVSLLGMRQDDDWIIKALYNDKDKIREVFSTGIWYSSCAEHNIFNINNGVEYRYVEIFFDQQYWGIFAMCHPLDEKQIGWNAGDAFYKKISTVPENGIDLNACGPVSGYEYLGEDIEEHDWEPLRRYYRILFSDEENSEQIQKLYDAADIGNSIDIFLFLNLIQGIDNAHLFGKNTLYNMFLTIKKDMYGKEKMLYTPWDMDRTWGLVYEDEYDMNPEKNVIMDSNVVTRLIEMGDKEILQKVVYRYNELRIGAWSEENLEKMILSFEDDIYYSGAYARDFEKWFSGSELNPTINLADFKEYVFTRLKYMDDFVDMLSNSPEIFQESRNMLLAKNEETNKSQIEIIEPVKGDFTNQLSISTDIDGSIYDGSGYKENTRISTTSQAEKKAEGWYLSGCIPANRGDVIYMANTVFLDINNEALTNQAQIYFYDKDYHYLGNSEVYWPENLMGESWNAQYSDNGDVIQFTIPRSYDSSIAFFRICAKHFDEHSIITVNEVIE